MYIRDQDSLVDLTRQLQGTPCLALDTEFVRERQYYPQLEIIQVATPESEAIIDYRLIGTLEPFTEILNDSATLKIFHAAGQDLEIFYNLTRRVPAPLFDTQVASAIVGLGAQVGYSRLIEKLVGVRLSKSETLTDWARRPLSEKQIEYALDDVRYLLPVYEILQQKLQNLGREGWLEDEWVMMTDPETYRRVHPREAYGRVQGVHRLSPKDLVVLRELAEWREREGRRRDRAPALLVRDNVLVGIARRKPSSRRELEEIRGLHGREIERSAREILDAVRRGRSVPRNEWPKPPERLELGEQESSLVNLLQAWLRARASEANIAPSYLAKSSDLKALVAGSVEDRETLAVLRGWRRRLIGDDLLALMEGRASLRWAPEEDRVSLLRNDNRP